MDVVDVGYVRDIDVVYIGHVNLAQIDIAVVIPGKERLAWTERKPGHHTADAEAHRKSRTAGERHERRTINRRYGNRPGYPTPPRADQQPASKMKRRESPGGSVHPGPAPGLNPDPASKAVRRPSDGYARRIPYWPVRRDGLPSSILVQIVESRNVGADVLARMRIEERLVPLVTPLIEAVGWRQADRADLHWLRATQLHGLPAAHRLVEIVSRDLHLSAVDGDERAVLVRIGFDPIVPRLRNGDGGKGSIHFDLIAGTQFVSGDPYGSLPQSKLDHLIIQLSGGQIGLLRHADRKVTGVQFGTRVLVRPQPVSAG